MYMIFFSFSSQDACPADHSLEESQVPPVPKGGGGESETSEQVSSHKPHPPKSSSPTKSPQHHSTRNSSPQPNDGIPTDMSDTTETEPDSKVTCKFFLVFFMHIMCCTCCAHAVTRFYFVSFSLKDSLIAILSQILQLDSFFVLNFIVIVTRDFKLMKESIKYRSRLF